MTSNELLIAVSLIIVCVLLQSYYNRMFSKYSSEIMKSIELIHDRINQLETQNEDLLMYNLPQIYKRAIEMEDYSVANRCVLILEDYNKRHSTNLTLQEIE